MSTVNPVMETSVEVLKVYCVYSVLDYQILRCPHIYLSKCYIFTNPLVVDTYIVIYYAKLGGLVSTSIHDGSVSIH